MKKPFKETKIGAFLSSVAPTLIDTIGEVFPPAKFLKAFITDTPDLSPEDKSEALALLKDYEQEELDARLADVASAREMYKQKSDKADDIAKLVMRWNLPVIVALVVINILATMYLDKVLIAVIANVVGMVLQSLINERQTLINFFFGSSEGSKRKDEKSA